MRKQTLVLAILWFTLLQSSWANVKPLRAHVSPPKSRIIGGHEVTPHSIPYQVGLLINGYQFCAGTLLSENYVLTAAHCAAEISSSVVAVLGAHNINSNVESNTMIRGDRIIIHEYYDNATYRNDVALITLAVPATFGTHIQPAPLPPKGEIGRTYEGEIGSATGWGRYHDTSNLSDVLLEMEVVIINLSNCAAYYNGNTTYVYGTNVCTSGYKNQATCDGDDGGPLILDGIQIGITSFGAELCESCSPSVYTRVVDYLDWIAANSDITLT